MREVQERTRQALFKSRHDGEIVSLEASYEEVCAPALSSLLAAMSRISTTVTAGADMHTFPGVRFTDQSFYDEYVEAFKQAQKKIVLSAGYKQSGQENIHVLPLHEIYIRLIHAGAPASCVYKFDFTKSYTLKEISALVNEGRDLCTDLVSGDEPKDQPLFSPSPVPETKAEETFGTALTLRNLKRQPSMSVGRQTSKSAAGFARRTSKQVLGISAEKIPDNGNGNGKEESGRHIITVSLNDVVPRFNAAAAEVSQPTGKLKRSNSFLTTGNTPLGLLIKNQSSSDEAQSKGQAGHEANSERNEEIDKMLEIADFDIGILEHVAEDKDLVETQNPDEDAAQPMAQSALTNRSGTAATQKPRESVDLSSITNKSDVKATPLMRMMSKSMVSHAVVATPYESNVARKTSCGFTHAEKLRCSDVFVTKTHRQTLSRTSKVSPPTIPDFGAKSKRSSRSSSMSLKMSRLSRLSTVSMNRVSVGCNLPTVKSSRISRSSFVTAMNNIRTSRTDCPEDEGFMHVDVAEQKENICPVIHVSPPCHRLTSKAGGFRRDLSCQMESFNNSNENKAVQLQRMTIAPVLKRSSVLLGRTKYNEDKEISVMAGQPVAANMRGSVFVAKEPPDPFKVPPTQHRLKMSTNTETIFAQKSWPLAPKGKLLDANNKSRKSAVESLSGIPTKKKGEQQKGQKSAQAHKDDSVLDEKCVMEMKITDQEQFCQNSWEKPNEDKEPEVDLDDLKDSEEEQEKDKDSIHSTAMQDRQLNKRDSRLNKVLDSEQLETITVPATQEKALRASAKIDGVSKFSVEAFAEGLSMLAMDGGQRECVHPDETNDEPAKEPITRARSMRAMSFAIPATWDEDDDEDDDGDGGSEENQDADDGNELQEGWVLYEHFHPKKCVVKFPSMQDVLFSDDPYRFYGVRPELKNEQTDIEKSPSKYADDESADTQDMVDNDDLLSQSDTSDGFFSASIQPFKPKSTPMMVRFRPFNRFARHLVVPDQIY